MHYKKVRAIVLSAIGFGLYFIPFINSWAVIPDELGHIYVLDSKENNPEVRLKEAANDAKAHPDALLRGVRPASRNKSEIVLVPLLLAAGVSYDLEVSPEYQQTEISGISQLQLQCCEKRFKEMKKGNAPALLLWIDSDGHAHMGPLRIKRGYQLLEILEKPVTPFKNDEAGQSLSAYISAHKNQGLILYRIRDEWHSMAIAPATVKLSTYIEKLTPGSENLSMEPAMSAIQGTKKVLGELNNSAPFNSRSKKRVVSFQDSVSICQFTPDSKKQRSVRWIAMPLEFRPVNQTVNKIREMLGLAKSLSIVEILVAAGEQSHQKQLELKQGGAADSVPAAIKFEKSDSETDVCRKWLEYLQVKTRGTSNEEAVRYVLEYLEIQQRLERGCHALLAR